MPIKLAYFTSLPFVEFGAVAACSSMFFFMAFEKGTVSGSRTCRSLVSQRNCLVLVLIKMWRFVRLWEPSPLHSYWVLYATVR